MNLLSRLYGAPSLYEIRALALPDMEELHHRELYKILESYYLNNGLYDLLAQALKTSEIWKEALKGLRNPAKRVVEFHVAHLWPGKLPTALPIEADNPRIIEPIELIWKWSNWSNKKQLAARRYAMLGDMVIKVVALPDQVYLQMIDPMNVSDIGLDYRGYVTRIRVDIPRKRMKAGEIEHYTHTEMWNGPQGAIYEHDQGHEASPDQMGNPVRLVEAGVDFTPFVHAKFIDIGDDRGAGAFTLDLDKIDEVNRKATRLAQMIFRYNKALWALRANAVDGSGRPLPAPRIGGQSGDGSTGDTIELGDDRLLRLPGQSELQSLVPDVNYSAHLDALAADLEELEQDLPELAYYRLREVGNLSGRAIELLLAGAVDKALEARGNAEAALERAHKMALTMGVANQLWTDVGSYEAGDFEHSFADRPVLPMTEADRAETTKLYVDAGVPLKSALRWAGKSDFEQLDEDLAEQQARERQTLAEAVLNAQRQMDAGEQSDGLEQGEGEDE